MTTRRAAIREPRGYSAVGLFNPKTRENVGSALRACGVYGASMLAVSGRRYHGSCTDTMKAYRHMPMIQTEDLHSVIPFDCVPVAVDLIEGATDITRFHHPERAFYVFGPEDGTLGKQITDWCKHTIYIPTDGCMNLAATVNVVLFDRMTKRSKQLRSAA